MFNHVLSIAAFGFVAFVIIFVHPASQAGHAVAQQMAAGGEIATAFVPAATVRPRLAASQ